MRRLACLLLIIIALPRPAHADASVDAACAVWQRELSFARSVQQHDANAFRRHVAGDAVFDATSAKPARGAATIARRWAAIIAGGAVHLDWYPTHVVASSDGRLAYSSGPYLLEDAAPNARSRYTIGHFATVWRLERDGGWRVAFDGGDNGKPASAAEVALFGSSRRTRCQASTVGG